MWDNARREDFAVLLALCLNSLRLRNHNEFGGLYQYDLYK